MKRSASRVDKARAAEQHEAHAETGGQFPIVDGGLIAFAHTTATALLNVLAVLLRGCP